MAKKFMLILILLFVIAIIWTGLSIYEVKSNVDVNPNAQTYLQPIVPQFNTAILKKIIEAEDALSIKPEDLRNYENRNKTSD